ncbi:uncharacterized protein [Hyperolius riggenbachi]|uniref:uncharacterized protein isoform X2 n=1 Tax=Hyperolius riggenbachi TaxID=752182 RepID=UPI0035A261C8
MPHQNSLLWKLQFLILNARWGHIARSSKEEKAEHTSRKFWVRGNRMLSADISGTGSRRDGSSMRNPPEQCTGPRNSQDCPHEDLTIHHHFQDEDQFVLKNELKEETKETFVISDQQSMEEGDMMGTIKELEEETYVRSDQQSMEEGDMMGTIKEEEETHVRSDQQTMDEVSMMRTSKEEKDTYVRSDQQSMEEGDMMRTIKEEGCPPDISEDGHSVVNILKRSFPVSAGDNGITQHPPGVRHIIPNTNHRLYAADRPPDPCNSEESSDRSHPVGLNTPPGDNSEERSHDLSGSEESSGKSQCQTWR